MDRYLGITNIKMLYVPFKSRSLEKLARAGAQPETSQNISLHNQNSRSLCSHFCDYSEIDLRLIICNICNINYIQRTNSKVLRVHNIVSYSPRGRKDDEGRECNITVLFLPEETLPRHEIYKQYATGNCNLYINRCSQPKKV